MSDQDTIFNSEETPKVEVTAETTTETTTSTVTDPLSEYVGEGRQFATHADFVKSFNAKQEHISTLESENKTYRTELESKQSVEEMLQELKQGKPAEQAQTPKLDPNVLDQLIEQKLSAKEQASVANANQQRVVTAMKEQYGDKAEEVYNTLSGKVGMSVSALNTLASQSPDAVLQLLGNGTPAPTVATSTGSVNTESLQQREADPVSAKVPLGASSKDMVKAFRAAAPKT